MEKERVHKPKEPQVPVECSKCGCLLGYVRLSSWEHDLSHLLQKYDRTCPNCGRKFGRIKFEVG